MRSDFIELHKNEQSIIVNLNWVEEIRRCSDGACVVYYAFNTPDAIEQDHFTPDESYDDVMRMVMKKGENDG